MVSTVTGPRHASAATENDMSSKDLNGVLQGSGGKVPRLLRVQGRRPGHRHRTVPRHGKLDVAPRGELVDEGQPAADRSIERRDVFGEEQISKEHRARLLVEDGNVVVGMCRCIGLDRQLAVAEIELLLVFDEVGRRDEACAVEGVAEQLLVDREIAFGACCQPARKLGVADEDGLLVLECDVTEDVIGVHVGVDHVLDRQLGARADGGEQGAPNSRAAARINDGDAVAADDEAGIRSVAGVARGEDLVAPLMHEDARRDFAHAERLLGFERSLFQRCKRRRQSSQNTHKEQRCNVREKLPNPGSAASPMTHLNLV